MNRNLLAVAAAVVSSFFVVAPAFAGVPGIGAYDLIKIADDHDASTHEDEAVYYLDKDWLRHPFPNQRVYQSWYTDFSGVKSLTKEQMAEFRLGKSITYRPGTRLVKIPSIPKVYAVEPGGSLRWLETEAVAIALYGKDWSKRVDDVSETAFTDYHEGASVSVAAWPTGTVVRRASDRSLFLIDGLGRHALSAESLATMHLNVAFAVTAPDAVIDPYPDEGEVGRGDVKFSDTAERDYLDTLPAPQFHVLAPLEAPMRGSDAVFARLRVQAGTPIVIRQIKLDLSGALRTDGVANLSSLHVTDGDGTDLFGIQQLDPDADTLTFGGAYTIGADKTSVLELRATASSSLPAGAAFTVSIDPAGLKVADGTNGDTAAAFLVGDGFAPVSVSLK